MAVSRRRSAQELAAEIGRLTGSPDEAKDREALLNELDVYQEELLAQNEQLQASQAQLEEARDRLVELYDFAGKRVRSFRSTEFDDATTLRWDLQAEGGSNVVNGVYLLVADLPSGMMRRKVFIVR